MVMEVFRWVGRNSKRIAVAIVGGAIVLAGLVMLVLPGPGILVVVLGFAILGTEFVWAAVALERTKRAAAVAGGHAKRVGRALTGRGRDQTTDDVADIQGRERT